MRPSSRALRWVARFARVSPGAGAHLALRYAGFRYFDRLERHVPRRGRVLDLGCGHGLFTVLAASRSPEREVVGIDLLKSRLQVGRAVAERYGIANVRFERRSIDDPPRGDFDAIVIADVLMYVPREFHLSILRGCVDRLSPGGILLVKEQVLAPSWKARMVAIQESITYGLKVRLGMSRTWNKVASPGVHLWDAGAFEEVLRTLGLHVQSEGLDAWSYLSHRLFVARAVAPGARHRPENAPVPPEAAVATLR